MAINLQKGQKIDIGPTKMSVGLGWTPHEGTGFDFDLDASAFMIDGNRQIPAEEFFIFYGNTDSPDKALHHTGDDPTGGNSAEGDDETIVVDLSKLDSRIQEHLLFVVTIYDSAASGGRRISGQGPKFLYPHRGGQHGTGSRQI